MPQEEAHLIEKSIEWLNLVKNWGGYYCLIRNLGPWISSTFERRNNWSGAGKEKFHGCRADLSWNLVQYNNWLSPSLGWIHQWRDGRRYTKEVSKIGKQSCLWIPIVFVNCKVSGRKLFETLPFELFKNAKESLLPLPLSHAAQSVNWNEWSETLMFIAYLYLKIFILMLKRLGGSIWPPSDFQKLFY